MLCKVSDHCKPPPLCSGCVQANCSQRRGKGSTYLTRGRQRVLDVADVALKFGLMIRYAFLFKVLYFVSPIFASQGALRLSSTSGFHYIDCVIVKTSAVYFAKGLQLPTFCYRLWYSPNSRRIMTKLFVHRFLLLQSMLFHYFDGL